jgi:hypothetical protein
MGTRPVRVEHSAEGEIRAMVEQTEADQEADWAANNVQEDSPEAKKAAAKLRALMTKAQTECEKKPEDEQSECMEKYGEQISQLQNELLSATMAPREGGPVKTVGCEELRLKVSGGKVTGEGQHCGTAGKTDVTGTLTPVK